MTQPITNDPILSAIAQLGREMKSEQETIRNEVMGEIKAVRDGLYGQLSDLAAEVRETKAMAEQGASTSERLDRQINGSGKPPPPKPATMPGAYANGEATPSIPAGGLAPAITVKPVVTRITGAEGSLTEVIGEITNLKAQIADVSKMNAAQNKVQGITADDAANLAYKFYTFIKSREGAKFVVYMATLFAMGYGAFHTKLALDHAKESLDRVEARSTANALPPPAASAAPAMVVPSR